jgi:hypothetical protein
VTVQFRIISIKATNGIATIAWSSTAGQTYRLQYKNNLTDPAWQDLTDVTAAGPMTSATDTSNLPQRFYRVMLVPAAPFRITSIRVAAGIATITWNSIAGQNYRLQYKNSLSDPNWHELPGFTGDFGVTAFGTTMSLTNAVGASPQRFYRVIRSL